MKRALVLLLLTVVPLAAHARVRAVHHPGAGCAFSLAPVWGAATIPAAGMTRGLVLVYGQTAACADWTAYASVDWITVEAAPLDAQPAAYVTIAANPATESRSATLIVAGIRLDVTQDGSPAIANPNLVTNGSFHTDIAGWIWYEGRFDNGRGAASWSALDANGSPASGSILMRDHGPGLAFQRLQCLPADKNTLYRFGAKVRTGAGRERGEGLIGLVTYPTVDCSGDYTDYVTKSASPDEPGVWQEYSFTMRTGSRTQAVIVVIASSASLPPFETWFDDVFVVPAE